MPAVQGATSAVRAELVHEVKHEANRLLVRRDGERVRGFTRKGHDWADRFPAIVDAALRVKAASFVIDGEAMITNANGTPRSAFSKSDGWPGQARP